MAFLGRGFGHAECAALDAAFGDFGQVIGVTSPVLQAEVGGPFWSQYPSRWETGVAVRIQPGPTGWNYVPVNLAKMLKRMEEMKHPPLSIEERQMLGLPAYGRIV